LVRRLCERLRRLQYYKFIISELWGILEGLRLAWRLGFRRVELGSDSLSGIKRLSGEESNISEGWSMLKHIRRLLQMEWDVKVCHTYREANRCADALAHIEFYVRFFCDFL
jgi:L1 cell adhesion molecule like protein